MKPWHTNVSKQISINLTILDSQREHEIFKVSTKSRQTKRQMFYLKVCRVYSKYLLRPENLASVSIKVCELGKTLSSKK